MGGWPDRSKEFKGNHFVPLFKISSDKKPCGDWTYSVCRQQNKRRSKKWVEDKKMKGSFIAADHNPLYKI